MAYRRSPRTTRFRRRPAYGRRKFSTRRPTSRPKYSARRRIGKRYSKRPAMTRRRILNVSTRKKTDHMLTGQGEPDGGLRLFQTTIQASQEARYVPACMTYMVRAPGAEDHTRRSHDVFFTGWTDRYRMYVGGGAAWAWRRIAFSSTDRFQEFSLPANLIHGYMRNLSPTEVPQNPLPDEWIDILFAGKKNIDWDDIMTAKVDRKRITVLSDVSRRLSQAMTPAKSLRPVSGLR